MLSQIIPAVAAYLIGSLNGAIILGKIFKWPDIRTQGSGNPGATNAGRIIGKKAAIAVGLFDLAKGFIVYSAVAIAFANPTYALAAGLMAIIGHIYPVYYGFKGGKGVATTLGVIIAYQLPLLTPFILTWVITVVISQYVSLASIFAVTAIAINQALTSSIPNTIIIGLMAILIIIKHKRNLIKIVSKTENKFDLIKFLSETNATNKKQEANAPSPKEHQQK